jgi:Spy/CpxP family protein refolding chaperone
MRIHSKIALALAFAAMALPAAYAQTPKAGQAAQQGWAPGPMMMRMRGQMRGGWGPGRGMGMRMGMMHRWGHPGPGFMLLALVNNPEMRQRVGITAEQAASIRQKVTEFLKGQIRNRADIAIQRLNLRNLLAAENPNRTAIDAALQQISTLRLAGEKAAVNFRLDMRNALTPAQRQKLMQMRRQFMRRGFHRWDMRGGRGMMRGPKGMNPPNNSGSGSK